MKQSKEEFIEKIKKMIKRREIKRKKEIAEYMMQRSIDITHKIARKKQR